MIAGSAHAAQAPRLHGITVSKVARGAHNRRLRRRFPQAFELCWTTQERISHLRQPKNQYGKLFVLDNNSQIANNVEVTKLAGDAFPLADATRAAPESPDRQRKDKMPDEDTIKRDARTSAVPGNRWSRLGRLGSLATGVAGNMLAEGARQFAQGKRPRLGDLLLTPANARRVADQLAQLRGAAMKVGQMLSMDAGDLLPPEIGDILARLRADARAMPMSQVVSVLNANWGAGWDRHFRQFSFTPVAAASIGQVHRAQTIDGQQLAVKIQYPGVRQSISSDVDNVAALLRLSGLLPPGLDLAPLLKEAKSQLHAEADYLREGAYLRRYGVLLASESDVVLPEMHATLTTENVLAMSYVEGVPIESLTDAPRAERDRIARLLFNLLFRELFDFRLVQTDPNFANYRYDTTTRRLILLDFGATRVYPGPMVDAYRTLMAGAIADDRAAMSAAATDIGYFQDGIHERQRRAVLDIFALACEPLRHVGDYDFGRTDLAARLRNAGLALSTKKDAWHTPPADAVFLHRKLAGLYLLAAKLEARVDLRTLVQHHLETGKGTAPKRSPVVAHPAVLAPHPLPWRVGAART